MWPSTSRMPISAATSAVPSEAASSSANADRNATFSVAIVERRYSSVYVAIDSVCAGPRRYARSVGRPLTTSRKCADRSERACQRRIVVRSVARPIRIPKTGINGSVQSSTITDGTSCSPTHTSSTGGTHTPEHELRQEAREVRLERIGAVQRRRGHVARVERADPTRARAHEVGEQPRAERRHRAGRGETAAALEGPRERAARDRDGGERGDRHLEPRQRAVPEERRCDDVAQERRLRDDRRRGSEREEHAENDEAAGGRNLPQEPRIERAHQPPGSGRPRPSGERSSRSSGERISAAAGSPRRARKTQYVHVW